MPAEIAPSSSAGQVLGVDPHRPWRRAKPRLDARPWPLYFIWFALGCQIGLLFLGRTPLRLPLRISTYGSSLLLLYMWKPRYTAHPALKLLKWVPIVLAVGLLHPDRNTIGAGVGQIFLYLSIYAPVAWVAGCRPSQKVFEKVILALWIFNSASAATGVLQVYFPGQFQGATSAIVAAQGNFQRGQANVVLADGSTIMRPFGLTDTPGGAATGGLYAIVLGAGIFLTSEKLWMRGLAGVGMLVGLFAIILSQVRVDLVMSLVCLIVLAVVLVRRGEWARIAGLGSVLGVVVVLGGMWAFAIGGKQTIDRFSTLTASNPTDVYSANRGFFLTELIHDDLPKYPFGAGLGRWGMMNFYFGNEDHTHDLWSEIMWTAWLFDGGVPLMVLYSGAFFMAIWVAWRLGVKRRDRLGLWAGVVFSYNAAALAGTFVFPLFVVQSGLEFWLINACLFSASLDAIPAVPGRRVQPPPPPPPRGLLPNYRAKST
jgi:hypothetical protein